MMTFTVSAFQLAVDNSLEYICIYLTYVPFERTNSGTPGGCSLFRPASMSRDALSPCLSSQPKALTSDHSSVSCIFLELSQSHQLWFRKSYLVSQQKIQKVFKSLRKSNTESSREHKATNEILKSVAVNES